MDLRRIAILLTITFTSLFILSLASTFFFKNYLFDLEDFKLCEDDTVCLSGLLLFRYMAAFVSFFFVFFMAFYHGGRQVASEAITIVLKEYSQIPRIINNILNHWIIKWMYDIIFDIIMYVWSWVVIPFTFTTKVSVFAVVFLILFLPFVLIYYVFINWKGLYEKVRKSFEEVKDKEDKANREVKRSQTEISKESISIYKNVKEGESDNGTSPITQHKIQAIGELYKKSFSE